MLHVIHDPGDAPGFYAGRQTDNELKDMEEVAGEMMEHERGEHAVHRGVSVGDLFDHACLPWMTTAT